VEAPASIAFSQLAELAKMGNARRQPGTKMQNLVNCSYKNIT